MSYRVQFTITDQEYAELQDAARKESFPSVSALCYARAFPNSSISAMFKELIDIVQERDSDEPFVIRELFPNRRIPSVLGRFFAEGVRNGSVTDVKSLGRNKTLGADEYVKIK